MRCVCVRYSIFVFIGVDVLGLIDVMLSQAEVHHSETDLYHYAPFDSGLGNSTKIVSNRQQNDNPSVRQDRNTANIQRSQLHMSSQRNVNTQLLDRVCEILFVSDSTRTLSRNLLSEVTSFQTCRGENLVGIQAVSLYYACLFGRAARSIQEVCVSFSILEGTFTKADKIFRETYRGNKSSFLNFRDLFGTADATDMITRSVAKLVLDSDISRKVNRLSFRLLEQIRQKKVLVGKSSGGITSAVIYSALQATGVNMSKKDFCADLKLTTTVTLNTMLKELKTKHLNIPVQNSK